MSEPEIVADTDAAAANAARILEFFAAVLGPAHDTPAVTGYLAADFVDHDPASGDPGAEGVREKLEALWAALPDGRFEPLQVVAAGDLVTVRSLLVAPAISGAPAVAVPFADTYRLSGNQMIEHWHVTDGAELGRQLALRG